MAASEAVAAGSGTDWGRDHGQAHASSRNDEWVNGSIQSHSVSQSVSEHFEHKYDQAADTKT